MLSQQWGTMKKPTLRRNQRAKSSKLPSRITNETIAAHRERILAGGRRFKYPIQYARHKLVFNAIIVVVLALVISSAALLWLLYGSQSTANFTYRITKVLPLPVAKVQDANVRYSDYLSYYNMSTYYLAKNEQFSTATADGKTEDNYVKRQSLDLAIENAYAKKLAKEMSIGVSDDELREAIRQDKQTANGVISDDTYERSAQLFYNMSADDFRRVMRDSSLRKKVRFAVDQTAKDKADKVESQVKSGESSIDKLKKSLGDDNDIMTGQSGAVTLSSGIDRVIRDVAKRDAGAVYGPFQTSLIGGEGYYFIKPIDVSAKSISYEYLVIPLHELSDQLEALRKDGSITEYIKINNQ